MKKIFSLCLLLALTNVVVFAQSISDEKVLQIVLKEREAGTSSARIVTKLMQQGVNIEQIRRVRRKAEKLKKETTMGYEDEDLTADDDSRLRTGKNAKKSKQNNDKLGSYQVDSYDERKLSNRYRTDESNQDWLDAQDEINYIVPDTATMLERLLAEKTKTKRKVFGRDIFNNETLSFEPNMNIATPKNYRLGPGDAVFIDVYGASSKSIKGTVAPDGTITIEGFGPVNVSGLTVDQANQKLRTTLGSRYTSSKIRLSVGETRAIMVNVMGNVKAPGTYTLSAFASVFHALYMAGGVDELGTLRNIKVFRNNQLISVVDIYDYILNGRLSGNVRLADNDVIIVGPYDSLVNIVGKVKRPMFYEMKKNESLQDILRYSGGFTGDAYKKSVRVIRKTGTEYSIHNVDEYDMPAFLLNDEDSITVDSVIQRFSNMVEIKGAVFRPGMYQVDGNINSVRALINAAEGLREEAFVARGVMHRMKPDRTLEVLSVDINGIMNGTSPDVALRANDVLFVPTKSEMMEERTITIHGEVHFPGVYLYADNETLEDFVLQAGGLKETASTVKVDVARRTSNPTAVTTDSLIARTYTFALKEGFVIDGESGFHLMPFDEVYVRKSPGYSKQQNVRVDGEVMFAGSYTMPVKNMRLSDALKAAGGLTDMAYASGARLERQINTEDRIRME
ncbi:MAG: SLBB domain-containing protein, partial [Prevotella sp.]|nr:SLBB domain-containing protein [Prevotella sp.]